MADAVAFIRWDRLVPWKVLSLKAWPESRPVPVGFGSNDKEFLARIKPGSRIWVVTRIPKRGPFSLTACVKVHSTLDTQASSPADWPVQVQELCEQWRYVAVADSQQSEFIETSNAEPVLAHHGIRFSQRKTICYTAGSLVSAFRSCMAQGRKVVFLSYRWHQARPLVVRLARELRTMGYSPWLDAMALPDYTLKASEAIREDRLQSLITHGISDSQKAIVIKTSGYGKGKWTPFELQQIKASGIPMIEIKPGQPLAETLRWVQHG
jgi:hypothetical protein